MSANQLEIIVNQVRLLPPEDLVKLIKKLVELLEQKQTAAPRQKIDYVALIGSGKGALLATLFTSSDNHAQKLVQ